MNCASEFAWAEFNSPVIGCRAFKRAEISVIVGIEHDRWHLSIAHPRRYPTWEEIKEARYRFVPDRVTMAMLLPPRREYINLHPNCFHLYELRETLILQPMGHE
jgi:hypothetical protein